MSKPVSNPTRLSCLPESEDTLGVGRMFRNGRELPDEELLRLRWRLRTSHRLRATRPRLFLKVALVVGLAFCTGGVVGAAVWSFWPRPARDTVVGPGPAPAPATKRRRARSVAPAPSEPSPAEPAPAEPVARDLTPAPKTEPIPAPTRHRARVHVAMLAEPVLPPAPQAASETAPAPVAPSAIAVEQSMLAQAMRTLRTDRDAQAALAVLGQYAERFPEGALASEASTLRVEALLALGRRDEALTILDRAPLAALPNRDERLVVRGELRATRGRWREARQDFDQALTERALPAATAKARAVQERALWGRAAARSRLGDQSGARTDLELYLRHFPGGRFAEPAASLLRMGLEGAP